MNVLPVSTWDVPCGIATYCANLIRGLDGLGIRSDTTSFTFSTSMACSATP
jgi:hypothetical protein